MSAFQTGCRVNHFYRLLQWFSNQPQQITYKGGNHSPFPYMVNRIFLEYPGGKQQREDDVLDTVWKIPVKFFLIYLCPKSRYNHRSIRKMGIEQLKIA
jgi:hypothetical protein